MVIEIRIPSNVHVPSVIEELRVMARQEGIYFSGTYPAGTFKGPGYRGNYVCHGPVLKIDLSPFFAEILARNKIGSILGSLQSIRSCA